MGDRATRFTLVELMIVVAITMVLAAIAIPQLAEMQLRSKRAELMPNILGIADAHAAYMHAFDGQFINVSWIPASTPGKSARAWTTGTAFATIGWAPDGAVRGSYTTDFDASDPQCANLAGHAGNLLYAKGRSDVDGDGGLYVYLACDFEPGSSIYNERVHGVDSGVVSEF